MGDRSPKDKQKKKQQHEKEIQQKSQHRLENQAKNRHAPAAQSDGANAQDHFKKAG